MWLRHCRLVVATNESNIIGLDLSEFRIRFSVSQAVVRRPSCAEITVYNVSRELVHLINLPINEISEKNRLRVFLDAGYKDDYGQIFQGELLWMTIGRESETETYLRLVAASGNRSTNFEIVSKSLPAGWSQKDVLDTAREKLDAIGMRIEDEPNLIANTNPRGKVIFKSVRNVLNGVAETNNFTYGFTDGGVKPIPRDGTKKDEEVAIVLDSNSGLIGRPVITPDGVEVVMFLNQGVEIGTLLQINNSQILRQTFSGAWDYSNRDEATDAYIDADGLYRVISREHVGDTRGTEWYTKVKCLGVNATRKPSTPNVAKVGQN